MQASMELLSHDDRLPHASDCGRLRRDVRPLEEKSVAAKAAALAKASSPGATRPGPPAGGGPRRRSTSRSRDGRRAFACSWLLSTVAVLPGPNVTSDLVSLSSSRKGWP